MTSPKMLADEFEDIKICICRAVLRWRALDQRYLLRSKIDIFFARVRSIWKVVSFFLRER